MQSLQQLSSFSAAEGVGLAPMEREAPHQGKKEAGRVSVRSVPARKKTPSPPSSPSTSKVEKRTRKIPPGPPFIHPLPTIETIMTYPSLSRPMYDSLVRGEPPAREYKTVIHTPKPVSTRTPDENLMRAADLSAWRRRNRSRSNLSTRSRSSTSSSVASSATNYSADSSSVGEDSSSSDISEPSTPNLSAISNGKAPAAQKTTRSPRYSLFPPIEIEHQPLPFPAPSGTSLHEDAPSRSHSPAQSFHSTHSTLSIDSSPASLAYPSPPASPELSRRSSSSGEEYMAYPSPPPSPRPQQQPLHRERRSFSYPPPSALATSSSSAPPVLRRTTSLNSNPWHAQDALDYDLGAQKLMWDLEPLGEAEDENDDDDMEWSMHGGTVILGAAGVAMSPRAMRGNCCDCGSEGLGLFVIDEEEEVSS
ncbi:hypothetical protein EJ04DRAFT_578452 [Polyplosphaeria fusca]|uniref:Uncharacterized protein n=1 Tax=Polyplosphaeria fusca TaxID=682080 RepID=A0A9P4QVY9_9PLEO|nr:hypothetical protein EJ04DRAFT_578452 [Polyplosphaeria fusca]